MDVQVLLSAFDKIITTSPGLQITMITMFCTTWYILPLCVHDAINGYRLQKNPSKIITLCRLGISVYIYDKDQL